MRDAVGGTPTAAVETTALPKKSLMIGVSLFGERARPRVQGSAPSLNPLTDVSDEGVADSTRGRARSPKKPPKPPLFLK